MPHCCTDSCYLLDLYRHWDEAAARKERVFIPISFLGFGAVAAQWDKLAGPVVVTVLGAASLLVYAYQMHLLMVIGDMQADLFRHLDAHGYHELRAIVNLPERRHVTVRRLRHGLFPMLGGLWGVLIWAKLTPEDMGLWRLLSISAFLLPAFVVVAHSSILASIHRWFVGLIGRPHHRVEDIESSFGFLRNEWGFHVIESNQLKHVNVSYRRDLVTIRIGVLANRGGFDIRILWFEESGGAMSERYGGRLRTLTLRRILERKAPEEVAGIRRAPDAATVAQHAVLLRTHAFEVCQGTRSAWEAMDTPGLEPERS